MQLCHAQVSGSCDSDFRLPHLVYAFPSRQPPLLPHENGSNVLSDSTAAKTAAAAAVEPATWAAARLPASNSAKTNKHIAQHGATRTEHCILGRALALGGLSRSLDVVEDFDEVHNQHVMVVYNFNGRPIATVLHHNFSSLVNYSLRLTPYNTVKDSYKF